MEHQTEHRLSGRRIHDLVQKGQKKIVSMGFRMLIRKAWVFRLSALERDTVLSTANAVSCFQVLQATPVDQHDDQQGDRKFHGHHGWLLVNAGPRVSPLRGANPSCPMRAFW
jgi:hypothetical protein